MLGLFAGPCDESGTKSLRKDSGSSVCIDKLDIYDEVAKDGMSLLFPTETPTYSFYETLSRRVERRQAQRFAVVFIVGVMVGYTIRSVL